jgi:hypothetical protein
MADIRVKDSDWNSLSPEMQAQIQAIVAQQVPGATVVADASGLSLAQSLSAEGASEATGLASGGNEECVNTCNSARDVAMASCALLGEPKAIAACMVITQIAAAICRATC